MTVLGRSIVRTTGFTGEPGINVIHWVSATGTEGSYTESLVEDWHQKLSDRLFNYAANIVTGALVSVDPQDIIFEDSTGQAVGAVTQSGTAPAFFGSGTDVTTSRADCVTVRHTTSSWVNGRRLGGRTFVGPMATNMFSSSGQVASSIVAATPGIWSPLTTGLDGLLVIWHRPTTPTSSDGEYAVVTGSSANSTPGTLRSRKT
jgi:hypothetical protein